MTGGTPRWPLLGLLAAAVVTPMVALPAAQADPPQGGTIVNSPKGFIGCLSTGTWTDRRFTIYCLAAQVPSTGRDAGRLVTNAWSCRYSSSDGSVAFTAADAILPSTALRVRRDGSFTFSARVPHLGRVSVTAVGGKLDDVAESSMRVTSPDGYRPQGYTLASPTQGLTTYLPPWLYQLPPTPVTDGPTPRLVSASVNGLDQDELVGTVWQTPTSGEWDVETC